MAVLPQSYELVEVEKLRTHPQNPRRGNVEALSESIGTNGFYGALIVQRSTGYVLAGNHRLQAARSEALAQLPVIYVDVDDDRARRILLADNRVNDLAGYDTEQLVAMLGTMPDLAGTGYGFDDLDSLVRELDAARLQGDEDRDRDEDIDGETDRDEVPATAPAYVQPGEVWLLGESRLVCGDSTDPDVVRAVVGQTRCDVMWTDPPYGVDYVGKTAEALTIQNDGSADLPALMVGFLTAAREHAVVPGAPGYVSHAAGPLSLVVGQAFTDAGWQLRQQLVWVKNSLVLGRGDYHYRHEPIWLGYAPAPAGSGRLGRGGERWHGDDSQTSVFDVDRPARSSDHPTMKPVELVRRMLANSCPPAGVVFEPFAGSGTTVIAAYSLGMSARAIELDPRYCDVICRRFEEHTGIRPVLESTGVARSFVPDLAGAS